MKLHPIFWMLLLSLAGWGLLGYYVVRNLFFK